MKTVSYIYTTIVTLTTSVRLKQSLYVLTKNSDILHKAYCSASTMNQSVTITELIGKSMYL